MIFHETIEDDMAAIEAYLADVHNVVVDYDPLGLDEYWIDDGVVTINDTRSKQEQLFVLLHEAGHVIVRNHPEFARMCPSGNTSKIEVLKEEVFAWEEARKLAILLNIPLGDKWTRHVRQAIMRYVHWVRV
tara:strand:+ start:272 stop:664 length:393 start_codon:yes stop_codon:yes gene_type:complete